MDGGESNSVPHVGWSSPSFATAVAIVLTRLTGIPDVNIEQRAVHDVVNIYRDYLGGLAEQA
jgi:hypothetical protein